MLGCRGRPGVPVVTQVALDQPLDSQCPPCSVSDKDTLTTSRSLPFHSLRIDYSSDYIYSFISQPQEKKTKNNTTVISCFPWSKRVSRRPDLSPCNCSLGSSEGSWRVGGPSTGLCRPRPPLRQQQRSNWDNIYQPYSHGVRLCPKPSVTGEPRLCLLRSHRAASHVTNYLLRQEEGGLPQWVGSELDLPEVGGRDLRLLSL